MSNKAYYIGEGYSIEEVCRIENEDYRCVIKHDNGTTNVVIPSTCFNSKEDAIKKVIENFERDIDCYEHELTCAQENLFSTKYQLQKFKEKYEI